MTAALTMTPEAPGVPMEAAKEAANAG
jgi:hypothetical protein